MGSCASGPVAQMAGSFSAGDKRAVSPKSPRAGWWVCSWHWFVTTSRWAVCRHKTPSRVGARGTICRLTAPWSLPRDSLRATPQLSQNMAITEFSIFYLSNCFEGHLGQDPKHKTTTCCISGAADFSQPCPLLTWREGNTPKCPRFNAQGESSTCCHCAWG